MDFFDLHCDTPYECYTKNEGFYVNRLDVSGEKGSVFDSWVQTFAFWIRDDAPNPFLLYKKMYADFKEKIKNKPENLTPLFAVEGAALLEHDSDRLFTLKEDGIRFLTLTWNGENTVAGGIKSQKGLTNFGKEVINKMNRFKIGCDLSHLNSKSFYSALEYAEFPLATHSNCKEICPHPRNLDINQIKLLCEKNGIIGLCFYPEFLGYDVYRKIYDNISFLCDKGYENNIAIGSDFDGAKMNKKLENICGVPALYEFLDCKGIGKEVLEKIFYQNAYKFIANLN